MWKSGCSQYLGPEAYRLLLAKLPELKQLKEKIEFIDTLRSEILEENGFYLMIKWIFQQFPRQFLKQFIPTSDRLLFHCNYCNMLMQRHIRMKPCDHVFCEKCSLSIEFSGYCCPICKVKMTDIDANPQIIKEQLAQNVKCFFSDPQRIQMDLYIAKRVTREENFLNLSDQLFLLQEKFNSNHYLRKSQNFQRRNSLDRRSVDLMSQINGQNYRVEFYHFQKTQKEIEIPACLQEFQFQQIDEHLQQCDQCFKNCPWCGQSFLKDVIGIHEVSCQQKLIGCPVCYQTDIRLCEYNQHVQQCLVELEAINNSEIPFQYDIDIDMELKVQSLVQSVDNLQNLILQQDSNTQQEVIELLSKDQKKVSNNKFWNIANVIYRKHIFVFAITFLALLGIIQDVCGQLSESKAAIFTLLALQILNITLFIIYVVMMVKSNLHRGNIPNYIIQVYIIQVLYFAGIYTTLQHIESKGQASFMNMLYLSGIVSGKVGFGDIDFAKISRYIAIVQIWFSSAIIIIIFKGMSFFFKNRSLAVQQSRSSRHFKRLLFE
uniref:Transmembrane domain-containing protein n=1 Tax=Trepomonas sp. PC1 TaxID=1076344 RepID=A0A146K9F5_9EUKA|eukprot:JAP92968.1 Transmembrane domain-containing protein [Trepomonas sp. PC1]